MLRSMATRAQAAAAAPAQAPAPAAVTLVVGEEEFLADRAVREAVAAARAASAAAGDDGGDVHDLTGYAHAHGLNLTTTHPS